MFEKQKSTDNGKSEIKMENVVTHGGSGASEERGVELMFLV